MKRTSNQIVPPSSCDWKLLGAHFASLLDLKQERMKKRAGFDGVFFGNCQQAFIAALKPRTCCISETRDPDTRVSLLSGNYLKGLIFWKRDSCFFFSFFYFCFFFVFLEKDKRFSRALEIRVFIILCRWIDDATPLAAEKARGLRLRDAHAWPQTRCVWRRTPDGLRSHMDALKQSKWAAAATLGKYNISGLTFASTRAHF